MPSTFSGLEIALRSLRANQLAMEIVNHNMANVNTEGYSRQRALMAATEPYSVPAMNREEAVGQVGTGVQVSRIYRYSSDYINAQMRAELPQQSRWQTIEQAMAQTEVILNEPSDTGISAALGRFWESWSNLAATPEDLATRTAVVEATSNLAFSIRDADNRLRELQADMDVQIRQAVDRINDIGFEIASLNDPISKVQAFGDQPNDLRDKRDALLDELSQLVDINYYENEDGTITVTIGGHPLVMGDDYSQLSTGYDTTNNMLTKIVWQDSGTPLIVNGVTLEGQMSAAEGPLVGGALGGAMYSRDVIVPNLISNLDILAEGLIDSVNKLHAAGYGKTEEDGTPRPSSAIGSVVPALPASPVSNVAINTSVEKGLGAGTYHLETRDNAGTWEFRLVDWSGRAVEVQDASGTGMTSDWQAIPLGTDYDTGRGIEVSFEGAGAVADIEIEYQNFFSGRTANELDISDWVRSEPFRIATSSLPDANGDSSVALAISGLRTTSVINGEYSVDDFYGSLITNIGLESKQASAMVANSEGLIDHLQTRKDEVSAVDLDEETVNLIQYQKAYQAAARVLTAVDEMLDRLINGTGRVGL